jgi:hypothetical protein
MTRDGSALAPTSAATDYDGPSLVLRDDAGFAAVLRLWDATTQTDGTVLLAPRVDARWVVPGAYGVTYLPGGLGGWPPLPSVLSTALDAHGDVTEAIDVPTVSIAVTATANGAGCATVAFDPTLTEATGASAASLPLPYGGPLVRGRYEGTLVSSGCAAPWPLIAPAVIDTAAISPITIDVTTVHVTASVTLGGMPLDAVAPLATEARYGPTLGLVGASSVFDPLYVEALPAMIAVPGPPIDHWIVPGTYALRYGRTTRRSNSPWPVVDGTLDAAIDLSAGRSLAWDVPHVTARATLRTSFTPHYAPSLALTARGAPPSDALAYLDGGYDAELLPSAYDVYSPELWLGETSPPVGRVLLGCWLVPGP